MRVVVDDQNAATGLHGDEVLTPSLRGFPLGLSNRIPHTRQSRQFEFLANTAEMFAARRAPIFGIGAALKTTPVAPALRLRHKPYVAPSEGIRNSDGRADVRQTEGGLYSADEGWIREEGLRAPSPHSSARGALIRR